MRGEILMNFHRVSGLYDLMQPSYDQITVLYVLAKNVIPFSRLQSPILNVFITFLEAPGILRPIRRIPRKRCQPPQNRPWVPHAGEQDDGS